MKKRRLSIRVPRVEVMWANRSLVAEEQTVYALRADKLIKYPKERSRIVYIGSTERGAARVAESMAFRVQQALENLRQVHTMSAHLVTCHSSGADKTWKKLERALLIAFRENYGDVPEFNTHGKGYKRRDEFQIFSESRVIGVLDELR